MGAQLTRFIERQEGAMTVFGLFALLSMIVIGGLALDVANAYMVRTHLQVAGDSAAHAALVARETKSAQEAKAIALQIAEASLPAERYGTVLTAEDIHFGYWDEVNNIFTMDAGARDAVLVNTARLAERRNGVGTFFLRFAGINAWNVRGQSVFETYRPTCFREGFVAEATVDIQSGNLYKSGFCVHSNSHVSLNSGNEFEPGVIVSMPDRRNIQMPSSGLESNTGLSAALRDGSYRIRVLQRIQDILDGLQDPSSPYYRDYITSSAVIQLNRKAKLDSTSFTPGRIHVINCPQPSQSAKIHAGTLLSRVVVLTNCQLMLGQGVSLEDAVIANSNTAKDSINSASATRLGRDDNCREGGGAQLVTRGGIEFPASLRMYGGQMIAAGDISFTSQADGIHGASVIAGGRIDGTTSMVMAFCGGRGMEDNFNAEYFRLAG